MITSMRQSTLETLGLGTVLEIFQRGCPPADTGGLVDSVFGNAGNRGSLVISGANGIVGAGKSMQLGSRLRPYDVPIVALDFPGVPDGIGKQYPGLLRAFGPEHARQPKRCAVDRCVYKHLRWVEPGGRHSGARRLSR